MDASILMVGSFPLPEISDLSVVIRFLKIALVTMERTMLMTYPFSTTVSSPLLARVLRAVCAALLWLPSRVAPAPWDTWGGRVVRTRRMTMRLRLNLRGVGRQGHKGEVLPLLWEVGVADRESQHLKAKDFCDSTSTKKKPDMCCEGQTWDK